MLNQLLQSKHVASSHNNTLLSVQYLPQENADSVVIVDTNILKANTTDRQELHSQYLSKVSWIA